MKARSSAASSYEISYSWIAITLQATENKHEVARRAKDSVSRVLGFPRLMDMDTAGIYTGTSYWTVRSAVQRGLIPVVEWPGEDGEPIRRVLIDRLDLDAFVDSLQRTRRPD